MESGLIPVNLRISRIINSDQHIPISLTEVNLHFSSCLVEKFLGH